MLISQQNAWAHLIVTSAVIFLSIFLKIAPSEWCYIIFAIVSVWTAEALNTAFEFLCDVTSSEFHPLVEKAKDVSAGAVLICCIGATLIGLIVLGPPLLRVFN